MDSLDIGLLVVRAVVGALMPGHGLGNLFGWLGGFGLDGTGEIIQRLGFRPGRVHAGVAGLTEVGGGSLLIAGLGTPLATAARLLCTAVVVPGVVGLRITDAG